MPRSTKANLAWIDAVGSKIAGGLSERYVRPMIYRQSGPYYQSKTPHVGIFFNDPILHHIASVNPTHKVDFRFGFYLERSFSGEIYAGFEIDNPTLSARFFMPNIRAERSTVAGKRIAWLRRYGADSPSVRFGMGDGQKHLSDGDDRPEELADALESYANLGRKEESSWKRAHFSAIVELPKYEGWDEARLMNGSGDLAEASLTSFKRLDFLYSMLFPRDLCPSRMSGGQNRALKARLPDRNCSWDFGDHCEGTIDAAHIKPDRLGGHAIPKNLFWLCQFHHRLLDAYLKATLTLDHQSRRIVASVRTFPPPSSRARGVPLEIWETIENKRSWPLPLKADSIDHLFD